MARDTAGNGSIVTTTDHETIRQWVEERGSTAARVTEPAGDDPGSLAIVPEGTDDDSVEEISWDEFFEIFEEENLAFVYQTARDDPNERWFCRFVDRERDVGADAFAADRAGTTWSAGGRYEHGERSVVATGADTVEDVEKLTDESVIEEGEVAETEITRTEVIEKEIVVTDRVRSRVVGSEIVERNTLESEVVDREVDRCEIVDDETVETEVLETRRVIEEVFELHTVESEVVDSETVERERTEGRRDDAAGEPTIEEPAIELADSGLEHGTIVESEIVRNDLEARELAEGEVVESEVVERRVIESEVVERILVRSEIRSVERIDSRLIDGEIVESEILERDSSERAFTATTGSADSEAEAIDGSTGPRVMVTEDEEGKRVVDAHGDEIGVVSAVREGTLYVDPDPGLAETVTSSLGWGGGDESYLIEEERIERITDDAVEITRP